MGVIQCPECGGKVSERLEACPHCGFPIGQGVESDPPPPILPDRINPTPNPDGEPLSQAKSDPPVSPIILVGGGLIFGLLVWMIAIMGLEFLGVVRLPMSRGVGWSTFFFCAMPAAIFWGKVLAPKVHRVGQNTRVTQVSKASASSHSPETSRPVHPGMVSTFVFPVLILVGFWPAVTWPSDPLLISAACVGVLVTWHLYYVIWKSIGGDVAIRGRITFSSWFVHFFLIVELIVLIGAAIGLVFGLIYVYVNPREDQYGSGFFDIIIFSPFIAFIFISLYTLTLKMVVWVLGLRGSAVGELDQIMDGLGEVGISVSLFHWLAKRNS